MFKFRKIQFRITLILWDSTVEIQKIMSTRICKTRLAIIATNIKVNFVRLGCCSSLKYNCGNFVKFEIHKNLQLVLSEVDIRLVDFIGQHCGFLGFLWIFRGFLWFFIDFFRFLLQMVFSGTKWFRVITPRFDQAWLLRPAMNIKVDFV